MRHIDFTHYIIIPADASPLTFTVVRVDPAEYLCERCSQPAEYVLRSSWSTVAECQTCMIDDKQRTRPGGGQIPAPRNT